MSAVIDSPGAIRELAVAFQASRIVLTAFELDVFSAIAGGAHTSREVAATVGGDPRAIDRLLNALAALDLLHKFDERFENTPATARFLVRGTPEYMAGLQHTVHLWDSWSGLTRTVREGAPQIRPAVNDRGEPWLEAFIGAMHARAQVQAPIIAHLVDLDGVAAVLDVGGGSAAFSIAFARKALALKAVVFDLPNVLPLTTRYVESAGLSDRIATVPGDYTRDPLPSGFDLVFLSAIVHSQSPAENLQLLRSAARAAKPGGRVAVLDWVMSADRTHPVSGALFALNMLVATEGGDTYTEEEMRGWFREAGLTDIVRRDTPFGTSLLIGRRG
jgi:SAM-dependent methyltransferase